MLRKAKTRNNTQWPQHSRINVAFAERCDALAATNFARAMSLLEQKSSKHQSKPAHSGKKKGFLEALGPGLITGASDDDPSGIATYSHAGASFGFGLLWVLLFCYPLMACVQQISATIGRVTGRGLAGNMRKYYPRPLLYSIVALLLAANIFNLGADIGAMAAAVNLLVGGPILLYAAGFALLSVALQVFVRYRRYARLLKWLTLALFAYVATAFVVHVPWKTALIATVIPTLSFDVDFITALVAVLGTTISPYLFFWQASLENEERKATPADKALKKAPGQGPAQLRRIRTDSYAGMAFANLVAFFIVLTTAVTLNANGITEIQTSAQAAEALRPIAGRFAFALFALGIIGTGLLALPVLGGSAAYAAAEAINRRAGLDQKLSNARIFYGILFVATLIGLSLDFVKLDPIKALFWSAVINGIVSGPVMIVLMLMASNYKVMGQFTLSRAQKLIGWFATLLMVAAGISVFVTWGK